MNTGMGNSLLSYSVLVTAMKALRVKHWDCFVDGDDILVFVDSSDAFRGAGQSGLADLLQKECLRMGFRFSPSPCGSFQEITHCRARPVLISGDWRMVRNPWRALATMFTDYRHFRNHTVFLRYMCGVAKCELASCAGVPILSPVVQHVLKCLSSISRPARERMLVDSDAWWRARLEPSLSRQGVEVTVESRCSFAEAFGIEPATQIDIEQALVSQITASGLSVPALNVADELIVTDNPEGWEFLDLYGCAQ